MILVSLIKEFKTYIAKVMYRISWTAGSISLAAICASAFDLNFDENGQCRKESRDFSACMRLTLDNMISRICTCSFCIACDFCLQVDLATLALLYI